MSDFDFDELDRAVTGALGNDGAANATDAELEDTLDTLQPAPVSQPQASSPAPVAAPISTNNQPVAQPTRPVTPATRRSSGRFMDVVHPSSDMRAGAQNSVSSNTSKNTPIASSLRPSVNTSAISQPETQSVAVAKPDTQSSSEPNADDVLPIFEQEDWRTPLESPFLADAKVEKRPLGGEAPTSFEFDPSELLEAPDDPRIEATTMPDPIDFAAQTHGIQQQVDTNESVEVSSQDALQVPEVEPVVAEEASEAAFDSHLAAIESDPEETTVSDGGYGGGSFQSQVTQEPDVPSGPTSISQQYQEQPSSSPESGAIYDTEAYHKPLAPVVKKKSSSLTILWIVLIVLLGGGAGAAFYFFVMPML